MRLAISNKEEHKMHYRTGISRTVPKGSNNRASAHPTDVDATNDDKSGLPSSDLMLVLKDENGSIIGATTFKEWLKSDKSNQDIFFKRSLADRGHMERCGFVWANEKTLKAFRQRGT